MGPFVIHQFPIEGETHDRLVFEVAKSFEGNITKEELSLKNRIENLLSAFAVYYKSSSSPAFQKRFTALHGIARAGLEGEAANVSAAGDSLKVLEREFVRHELMPRQYRMVGYIFVSFLVACVLNFILFQDSWLATACAGSRGLVCSPFNAIHGHFVGYINFFYVIYGVLIGTFINYAIKILTYTLDQEIYENDFSSAPLINTIISLVVAYVICLLVKFGKFDIQVFDIKLSDFTTNGSIGVLLGFFIAIGAKQYVSRLLRSPAA